MNRWMLRLCVVALIIALAAPLLLASARAAERAGPHLQTLDRVQMLTPNDKLATYGLDDPEVEGVACHFTVPERGGLSGWIGVAEEVSDISLACRQIGPIRFKAKFAQGEDVFRQRRSLFFKKMQIVRGCDVKRNVLVYMVYSDRLIEGSPKNSTSSVPIMPWGASDSGAALRRLRREVACPQSSFARASPGETRNSVSGEVETGSPRKRVTKLGRLPFPTE